MKTTSSSKELFELVDEYLRHTAPTGKIRPNLPNDYYTYEYSQWWIIDEDLEPLQWTDTLR